MLITCGVEACSVLKQYFCVVTGQLADLVNHRAAWLSCNTSAHPTKYGRDEDEPGRRRLHNNCVPKVCAVDFGNARTDAGSNSEANLFDCAREQVEAGVQHEPMSALRNLCAAGGIIEACYQ